MPRRPIFTVLKDIEEFAPAAGNWRRLDELLDELWSYGVTQGQIPFLFRVFERFPEDDGGGVLWSIVHGVESLAFDYDTYLRESMARQPSQMGAIMLQRLQKATESR
ncbi:MAG: hypothetical protein SXG53_01565 [Pseudomonadota bacterium]|nr:hypothetical protein [Pseudomonadota bacterium]